MALVSSVEWTQLWVKAMHRWSIRPSLTLDLTGGQRPVCSVISNVENVWDIGISPFKAAFLLRSASRCLPSLYVLYICSARTTTQYIPETFGSGLLLILLCFYFSSSHSYSTSSFAASSFSLLLFLFPLDSSNSSSLYFFFSLHCQTEFILCFVDKFSLCCY